MNRKDLQALAEARLDDGAVLLGAGRYAGSFYMLGYALECGLKAAIAKQIREHDFPDRKLIADSYTHDLVKLLDLSGLRTDHRSKSAADPVFAVNWSIAKDWHEARRYDTGITDVMAHDLHVAITDPTSGVLPWLRTLW